MITQELLKSLLHYDKDTGVFTWLADRTGAAKVGKRAGWITSRGYRAISVKGKDYLAHQLAFLYVEGVIHSGGVDHRNNNKDDNSFDNLRKAGQRLNNKNASLRKDNRLGVKGVRKRGNRFEARIQVDGKSIYLGSFKTLEEAKQAYNNAADDYHKDFANYG